MTEKEFYVLAGKRLKEIRADKGITQEELSQKTGIDRTLISKFENTGKKISMFRVKQLLDAMDCSLGNIELHSEKKTLLTSTYQSPQTVSLMI